MSDTAQAQILTFIRGRYPQVEIDAAQDIFQLGFVNSLFAMELVMFVEKTFGVTIPNDELQLDHFRTADSMAALVGRLSPAPAGV
ncbi:acyl carrier protein [Actinokineospora xionganensis]|uniref:Acyl carrier protein n=1 Tax=Actinokineospora xionganensis TaxID=2684470 RepID=A0ABR7L3X5_9PSEU|nr:acyl carrier protein [Actinokineospora xionganensis]MBC6447369.1 acyl carrier protein [Actinokineospora xionganensis]